MLSKTFCVLPWYSQEILAKNPTPCCLLPQNANIESIKKDLLSGVRAPECKKCWAVEDLGKDSRRLQENRFLDWKLDRAIDKIQDDCLQELNQPLIYQIRLSNLCNQACLTCSSSFSTKWAEIENKMGIIPVPAYHRDIVDLNINFNTAERIYLVGGEPMFDPQSFQLLEKLLEHGNDRCFISFVTNGSVKLNKKQRNILKNFKNLNICFSIDGIGLRFEYMRWPGKWSNLVSNLDQYRTITDNFSISYTISSINAIYYDETVGWFDQQKINYSHNIVYYPLWASVGLAPMAIKKQLQEHSFLNSLITESDKGLSTVDFVCHLEKQDRAKKISWRDYLPELSKLLNAE